jgi:hypothetical protein
VDKAASPLLHCSSVNHSNCWANYFFNLEILNIETRLAKATFHHWATVKISSPNPIHPKRIPDTTILSSMVAPTQGEERIQQPGESPASKTGGKPTGIHKRKLVKQVPNMSRLNQYHQGMSTENRPPRTFFHCVLDMPPLPGVSPIRGPMSFAVFRAMGNGEVAALK